MQKVQKIPEDAEDAEGAEGGEISLEEEIHSQHIYFEERFPKIPSSSVARSDTN